MGTEAWRHYKGGLYEIVCGALHTETGEALIVYQGEDGKVWARPSGSFHDTVEVDGRVQLRFERVGGTRVSDEEIQAEPESTEPEEKIREHVKCSYADCKSVFWRPQDASAALSTADLAQFHGWTILDRERGLLHCAWGH